ncbi:MULTISPECIES: BLUF domain-containing protein [Thiomicrorhabdus]|uniref:BLUF domain-containing protein n=1 Tax=Thiomicrorhabdus heinhorstiae TaxID=2748010 RepID=A0ABS0BT75_9GAMM|nr:MULTISPECIES: BLUF domain-containing protein [Thiomicrorhabdus]MBF6057043.1 BLUF domain-containing protein [Thiomicrorhabdus heinhorstiae]
MSADNHENLIHLIYISSSKQVLPQSEIDGILQSSRRNNGEMDVSGMLLYADNTFFQVLEGELSKVEALYDKISADPRHLRVMKLIQEPIEERDFADWTMGFSGMTRQQLNQIDGLNDFFLSGESLISLDEGRARKLLLAFKDGAWRQQLR